MSRFGLLLCFLYSAISGLCVCASFDAGGDVKGAYIFRELPMTLQLAALDTLGFQKAFYGWSWIAVYAVLVPPTLAALYFLGRRIGAEVSRPPGAPTDARR